MKQVLNAVHMAQRLLLPKLSAARYALDGTAGNGKDTLFLAQNTPPDAIIYAFDIQAKALSATQQLIMQHGLRVKVRLVLDSHANLDKHIEHTIDAAMLNLGYLPGASHELTTTPATTVAALEQLTAKLAPGGMVTIVAYPGHAIGEIEEQAVQHFLSKLPQKTYTVGCWRMINQVNKPPVLYIVEKSEE